MTQSNEPVAVAEGKLQRELGFWALVAYGVVFMYPVAGLIYFPATQPWSGGHSTLSFLIGTVVVILTALGYQKMVAVFPQAGSAYTYASKGINGKVGFIVGWALLVDYVLIPTYCLTLFGLYCNAVLPMIPSWAFVILGAVVVFGSNMMGIKMGTLIEVLIGILAVAIVVLFVVLVIAHNIGHSIPLFQAKVILDPATFVPSGVVGASALAILSFVGFDGITTLTEEAKVSAKKIGKALMAAVIIQGAFLVLSEYCLSIFQDWTTLSEGQLETAYRYMLGVMTSDGFAGVVVIIQQLSSLAVSVAAITAASRVLFSMGRDGVLPKKFFGHLSPKTNVPSNNITLLSVLTLVGALTLSWTLISEIVSFGACLAFLSVNVSVIVYFFFKKKEKKVISNLLIPLIAIAIFIYIITSLTVPCKIVGFSWMAVGIIYLLIRYNTSEEFKKCINEGMDYL